MNRDTSGIKTTKIIAEDISHWHFDQASVSALYDHQLISYIKTDYWYV